MKVIPIPVILIDSVYRKDENSYSEVFFKKYHSPDDSNDSNEKLSMKKIRMKKTECISLYLKKQTNC